MVEMKEFTLETANKVIARAPRSTWSDGVTPPPLHPHILKKTKGNKLKKAGKLRYTAFNMTKFALARCATRVLACPVLHSTALPLRSTLRPHCVPRHVPHWCPRCVRSTPCPTLVPTLRSTPCPTLRFMPCPTCPHPHTPTLTRHSVELFEPLLSTEGKCSSVWKALVAHVHYFRLLLKDEYTTDDVVYLDTCIIAAQRAFREVRTAFPTAFRTAFRTAFHAAFHAAFPTMHHAA